MRLSLAMAAGLLGIWVSLVHAAEGVLEINQDCALATGCFSGDAPGYPVTIQGFDAANPGAPIAPARSFRLTGDLGPLAAGQTAIVVNANAAVIDLNGFRIFGTTTCSAFPTTCSPLGTGVGVLGGSDVTVKNGTIHGMGDDGVRLGYSSRAEGLHLFHNGADGIDAGNESLVHGNISTSNRLDGIRCAQNCGIHENTATGNGAHGIESTSGSVTGNAAASNGARGGQFGARTLVAHNVFASNAAPDLSGGRAASGNVCGDGGCSSRGQRRFYLSVSTHNGAQASSACASGFHMANLWEIFDVSVLEYDRSRGLVTPDSAQGPPSGATAWVRTGSSASTAGGQPGVSNCAAWTSASASDLGTTVALDSGWDDGNSAFGTDNPPWLPIQSPCSAGNNVWCVED